MLIKVHRFNVINLFYGYGFIKCNYELALVYLCIRIINGNAVDHMFNSPDFNHIDLLYGSVFF